MTQLPGTLDAPTTTTQAQAGATPTTEAAPTASVPEATTGDGAFAFFATCPKGFERLLSGELAGMGLQRVRTLVGQVSFQGPLADAYRACLWSRLASRVVLVLAHVDARDADALYQGLYDFPWEQHLPLDKTFAIDAHGANANLRNTQFVALRSKDAICDRMQAKLGGRPSVDAHRPAVSVVVRIRGERATCGIDLSGSPLFHRSTVRRETAQSLGALRPDYAAALLACGGWFRCCRRARPTLVCGYPGAGVVVAEAAAIALDRAPGLMRARWGFASWLGHDAAAWSALVDEADKRARAGAAKASELQLIAIDPRRNAAGAATQALRGAGLDVSLIARTDAAGLAGAIATNGAPEDGAVLAAFDLAWIGEGEQAREVAALALASDIVAQLPAATPITTLTFGPTLDTALGLDAVEATDVFVGRDTATIRKYLAGLTVSRAPRAATAAATGAHDSDEGTATSTDAAGAKPRRGRGADAPELVAASGERQTVTLKDGTTVPVLVAASDQFAARLAKVAKLRAKWARREGVTCYRVYDADLPDYAVAIDLYQASELARGRDAGQRWLVVQEYAAPKEIDAELAHKRLLDVLAIAPRVMDVKPENVTLRVRRRAKGGSQYADAGSQAAGQGRRGSWLSLAPGSHLVDEGGLVFEVNLAERLDTGLFLDHRDVRAEVREMVKQTRGSQRFLNLFAYTGTATCYAADGGAGYTTTVDLSNTYLDWAERNMARNGFTGPEHEYIQADVMRWISEQRRTKNRWDLVFCDPPTFSNSKRMRDAAFDIQRDHVELLIGISRILTRNGSCLFSCNLRGFTPDVETLNKYGVQIRDVTAGSIPEDFKRNAKIHHCYEVWRTPLAQ